LNASIRKAAGLSQEDLSLNADLDRSYVSQIERAVGNPSLQVLTALAKTLHCDVTALLAPEEQR
jgi:transcriptional regulator with XRE-family HTH domain